MLKNAGMRSENSFVFIGFGCEPSSGWWPEQRYMINGIPRAAAVADIAILVTVLAASLEIALEQAPHLSRPLT